MKRLFLFVLALPLAMASSSWGAMASHVTIEGRVGDMARSYVIIKTQEGPVKVPRSVFRSKKAVHPGDKVSVEVALTDIIKLNHLDGPPSGNQKKGKAELIKSPTRAQAEKNIKKK